MNDEQILAYVDGEMSGTEMQRMDAAMAGDAVLRARVEEQRQLRDALRVSFDPVLSEPMPATLTNAAMMAPVSWRWRLRALLTAGQRSSGAISIPRFAMTAAATLVLGVVIGRTVLDTNDAMIGTANGVTVARGELAQSLETRLASDSSGGTRIGVSFASKDGRDCRTFAAGSNAGIACKSGDAWQIAALTQTGNQAHREFQAAGAAMPDAIRAQVQQMMAGDAFDAAAERAARDKGWAH